MGIVIDHFHFCLDKVGHISLLIIFMVLFCVLDYFLSVLGSLGIPRRQTRSMLPQSVEGSVDQDFSALVHMLREC